MKLLSVFFALLVIASCSKKRAEVIEEPILTYCNPVDINYRFQANTPRSHPGMDSIAIEQAKKQAELLKPYREAADPVIMLYNDKYLLFASHSGGYWYSDDMHDWNFISIESMPVDNYAPAVIARGDTVFFKGNSMGATDYVYYNPDPFTDNWKPLGDSLSLTMNDACFFEDDDGELYSAYGLSMSEDESLRIVKLDNSFQPVGDPLDVVPHNPQEHGWENPGEYNEIERNGCNEGSWLTKYNDKYYFQFATPGTEYRAYADGAYTSDSPLGPYKYEDYSPFSYKPEGFIRGAGHSSTFQDKYSNYWHIATQQISIRHNFERRIGLFPAYFDKDGVLRTITAFGDYPTIMPDRKIDFETESLLKGWMLLSYNKNASASSSLKGFPFSNAFDEDIQKWWSAETGNAGEWLSVELSDDVTINAIQLNFADQDANLGPETKNKNIYCYKVLVSNDQQEWEVIIDKSNNDRDACHEYIELDVPVSAKYIKVENVKVPDGKFSIYDLRIFGNKKGEMPNEVLDIVAERDDDTRRANVKWRKDDSTTGYVVNYGISPEKLYSSIMVYGENSFRLTALNKGVSYYISIDSFNETGITKGSEIAIIK